MALITKETKWLCEHARALERYSGKWILFNVRSGMVAKGASLQKVLKSSSSRSSEKPFVFHVPSKKDLGIV